MTTVTKGPTPAFGPGGLAPDGSGPADRRRAKIICTLGPATQTPDAIRALVDAGMDVARLNLSHGTHAEHAAIYSRVREASDAAGRAVGVLADLQGPKIRLGTFRGGVAVLTPGAAFTVTTRMTEGTSERAWVSYEALARDVAAGDTLLLDDGMVKLTTVSSDGTDIECRVIEGGLVSDHKGVNLPGAAIRTGALTDKDVEDLEFALRLGVDVVALSFVRSAGDHAAVRRVMDVVGRTVPVVAKIEKPEAVSDLAAIVDAFDGILIARGDLGIELSLEQVPMVQKQAAQLARQRGKPVIVATQMLESMIHHSRPTRAEVSDVANAVLDGADALMLAGETSVGEHAVAAVRTLARIAATTENEGLDRVPPLGPPVATPEESIAAAAAGVARTVRARALAVFTQTGRTARCLASHRTAVPVLAFTSEPEVRSNLALTWGVETFLAPVVEHTSDAVAQVEHTLLSLGRAVPGDRVVIVAGRPGHAGTTNAVRVHELASQ
ncbi:MAG TPA: pyruvate kinase [Acidimicrobiales bacterium]|nr:pyruvate kinase [Acidimicrobiales bacterium]